MKKMNQQELKSTRGGFGWIIGGIVAAVIFVVGIFDGYTRPLRCN